MKEMGSCLKSVGMNVVNMTEIDPFAAVDGGDVLFTGTLTYWAITKTYRHHT